MRSIRAVLAICSVAISGAAGCAQPGIVEIHEMTPPMGAQAQDGSVVAPAQDTGVAVIPVQDTGVIVPAQDSGVIVPVQDSGPTPVQDSGTAPLQDSGPADTGPAPLPPCPTGYTCSDPGAMIRALGASGGVTYEDGGVVPLSCGKGGIQDCNRQNPKASCPDFVNPFCAHLTIEFPPLDSWTCAQACKL
jgi:hypothetical protein